MSMAWKKAEVATAYMLLGLYLAVGLGGDGWHYLFERQSETTQLAVPPAAVRPGPIVHRHGPGGHWHVHRPAPTQASRDVDARFVDVRLHEHDCRLLALVSALEFSLALAIAPAWSTDPAAASVASSTDHYAARLYTAHLARGPPLLAVA